MAPELLEESAMRIAIEARSHAQILEERFDRHMNESRDANKSMAIKVDDLVESVNKIHIDLLNNISNARIDQIKDDKNTNIKIYTLNGLLSLFVSFITNVVAIAFRR